MSKETKKETSKLESKLEPYLVGTFIGAFSGVFAGLAIGWATGSPSPKYIEERDIDGDGRPDRIVIEENGRKTPFLAFERWDGNVLYISIEDYTNLEKNKCEQLREKGDANYKEYEASLKRIDAKYEFLLEKLNSE